MQAADLEVIKEIPGYKVILKTVLKSQIQQLVEQLADHTGEESVILTASIADGSLSHLGSESGKVFLEEHDDIKSQFLGFCLKRHHKQKQIEKEKQEQEQQKQNASNTPQGYGVGPRPRFAPIRPRQNFQSGLHPVSVTRSSSQSNSMIRTAGQRHQPYPLGRPRANFGQSVKRLGGAMRLPTEQNKTPKVNVSPNQVIKTEAPDMENVVGNNMEQSTGLTTESGTMESSGSAVNSAIACAGQTHSTSSQSESSSKSGETTTMSSIIKGEPQEVSAGNGDTTVSGSYSEMEVPVGLSGELLSIKGISDDSAQGNTSVSSVEQNSSGSNIHVAASVSEQNVIVKTEAEDDEEELEITGVEPGQMSVSDKTWMSNIPSSIGYDQSMSGAVSMGGSSGQGYVVAITGTTVMETSSNMMLIPSTGKMISSQSQTHPQVTSSGQQDDTNIVEPTQIKIGNKILTMNLTKQQKEKIQGYLDRMTPEQQQQYLQTQQPLLSHLQRQQELKAQIQAQLQAQKQKQKAQAVHHFILSRIKRQQELSAQIQAQVDAQKQKQQLQSQPGHPE